MEHEPTVPFKIDVLIGEEDPIDDRCINIRESILNAFKSRPDFIGQVDATTGAENTFQQMRERSVKCALWLKKLGVQRNDVIIVYSHNHFNTYIPLEERIIGKAEVNHIITLNLVLDNCRRRFAHISPAKN